MPQCGFSNTACRILDAIGCEYSTVNVLDDDRIRNGIKIISSWPTIPQLYVNKEFIGGTDIMIVCISLQSNINFDTSLPIMTPLFVLNALMTEGNIDQTENLWVEGDSSIFYLFSHGCMSTADCLLLSLHIACSYSLYYLVTSRSSL